VGQIDSEGGVRVRDRLSPTPEESLIISRRTGSTGGTEEKRFGINY
jgi:hypothetical protein